MLPRETFSYTNRYRRSYIEDLLYISAVANREAHAFMAGEESSAAASLTWFVVLNRLYSAMQSYTATKPSV